MTQDLVIIGCGGFGREAADVVDAINRMQPTWNLLGFIDDRPSLENVARVERRGSRVLGGLDGLAFGASPQFVVGIGDATVRSRIAAQAEGNGWEPAILIHPTAAVGANADIGGGSIVCAHVTVGSDVTCGRHVHLDRGVQVGHDSVLADFVTAHPAAVISGTCMIEHSVELGTNCTLLPGLTLGHECTVGAGSVVTKNFTAKLVIWGVPAAAAE